MTAISTLPDALRFDRFDGPELAALLGRNAAPVNAVATPWPTWNRACRDEGGGVGLARGWHVVLAGATGTGKSALALNLAAGFLAAGEHVLFVSLEMSQRQLYTRLLAITSGTSVRYLEPGPGFDKGIAQTAANDYHDTVKRSAGSIRVNRYPLQQLRDIDLAIEFHATREPRCTVVITDYLQLAWAGSAKSMLENITEVSHAIRARAALHGVVSIGLSQFNRQTSANRSERPHVEGLMGGSPLENDADQVILLDHSSYERTASTAQTKLLLAKNRHGPQVEIPVQWDYSTLRMREDMAT